MAAWKFIPKSFWSLAWYQYSCCSQLCSNCSKSKVGLWPHLPTKLGHFLSLVTTLLSAFPLYIPLPFRFSWPVLFSSLKAQDLKQNKRKRKMYIFTSSPQKPSLPSFLRMHYRAARRRARGMYWFGSRSPVVLPGLSGELCGWWDGHCWGHLPGAAGSPWAWHREPDTACKHCWTKGAPWESRSKQCDCISRLMQLIPAARVNCLIQCITSVQAVPWAGTVIPWSAAPVCSICHHLP